MYFTLLGFTISWPLVGLLVALLLSREIWNVTYFKRQGIVGPTPWPLMGNLLSMNKGFAQFMTENQKKFGSVFGVFIFRQPIIVVCEPEMLKEITVKSFSKFVNHKSFVLENKPFHKAVTVLRDQHWKDVRNVITPTFSGLKMKQMSPLINECCDTLLTSIIKKRGDGNEVNVNNVFESFTMDGIAKCAFGLQVDSQDNPDDPFVKNAKSIMSASVFAPMVMIAGMFPPIAYLMNALEIGMVTEEVKSFFRNVVVQAMEMKKQASSNASNERKDFLQLMMNAHEDDGYEKEKTKGKKDEEDDLYSLSDDHDASVMGTKKRAVMMTLDEILGQALFFFVAGYETTNITLGFIAYALATNPDVQDKLIAEVDEVTPTRDSVNYASIAKLAYLDGVVCETLRLYPPAAVGERECNETCTVNGITFEKGVQVLYSIFDIHRNPEFWPDPETFDPTRFNEENREGRHPYTWIPFGSGPRNCIGMRFALMEIKMAIVRLLQKYRFETGPSTVIPPKLGIRSVKPLDGITLRVVERNCTQK